MILEDIIVLIIFLIMFYAFMISLGYWYALLCDGWKLEWYESHKRLHFTSSRLRVTSYRLTQYKPLKYFIDGQ